MTSVQVNGVPVVPKRISPAHDALLERYLHLLRADSHTLVATAHPGWEHTLQWATDELRHTASTLRNVPLEDAEYELQRVMREARERLGLT